MYNDAHVQTETFEISTLSRSQFSGVAFIVHHKTLVCGVAAAVAAATTHTIV